MTEGKEAPPPPGGGYLGPFGEGYQDPNFVLDEDYNIDNREKSEMKRKINTIVDGQYGSTGKGSIAAYIALRDKPDTIITAWSPNAGHTAIVDGVKYVHTMLANGIVSPNLERILIGPGSVVNLPALLSEFEEAKKSLPHLGNVGILFHPNAVIVDQKHRDQEAKTMGAIGSTKKGSGAALIEKLMRNPESKIIAKDFGKEIEDMHRNFIVTNQTHYAACLATTRSCLIEGAQGFSLGINSGFYPYTTSRECTPQQLMIDCQLPRNWLAEMRVIMTMRTYPIRVNNAQGYSGPCYNDQEEIEFKDIPCPPAEVERTTVTKLPRRVFTYSGDQIHSASRIIRPDEVFLNFMNYVGTEWNKETSAFAEKVNDDLATGAVCYVGWGPEVTDIEGM